MSISRTASQVLTPCEIAKIVNRRSLAIGITFALCRFLNLVAAVLLLGWSYSIWGSPDTPMRALLYPAIGILVVSFLLRVGVQRLVAWTWRACQVQARREACQERIRAARAAGATVDDSDCP